MSDRPAAPPVGWTVLLDRFDAALDAAWVAIGGGDLEQAAAAIDDLERPLTMPALPPEVAGRARRVLGRLRAVDARLESARRATRHELAVARRLAPADRSVARFIDRTT